MNKTLLAAAVLSINFPFVGWCGEAMDSLVTAENSSQAATVAGSPDGARHLSSLTVDGGRGSAVYAGEGHGKRGPGDRPRRKPDGERGGGHRGPGGGNRSGGQSSQSSPSQPGSGNAVRDAFDEIMPDMTKDEPGTALLKGFGGALIAPFYLAYKGGEAGAEKGVFGAVAGGLSGLVVGIFAFFMGPIIGVIAAMNNINGVSEG